MTLRARRGPGSGLRRDARWLLLALGISLAVFLVATANRDGGSSAPPEELPTPSAQVVALGRPDPTVARIRIGEFLRIAFPMGPDEQYATLVSSPPGPAQTVLEVTSAPQSAPQVRGAGAGTVLVTVLLEPRCPPEGVCRNYRQNLGAVRVTVLP